MARPYRLKRRAERQSETRQRIIEATVELHTTVGPARTSILAIAERAGVERPTVYRHFPTPEALFSACTSHYQVQNPLPDPEPWQQIGDPETRLRCALGEMYAYYAANETAYWSILRDFEDTPELRRFGEYAVRHHQRVIDVLAAAWPDRANPKLRAALNHATDFFAWRSLRRSGLSNDEAIDLMAGLVRGMRQ
jgi:AcrR family transcriptional regulator